MNKVTRILTITGIMVSLFLVGVTASMGANMNSVGMVNATEIGPSFTSVVVTSNKEISNVVMLFCNGDVQKVEEEDLVQDFVVDRWTATVSGSGDFEGLAIMSVWVKSGSFRSGDGSGYGGMIAFTGTCGVVELPQ